MKKIVCIIAVVLAFVVTYSCNNHNRPGEVHGTVSYREKALSDAVVKLTAENGEEYTFTTNVKGYYYFREIPTGDYIVTISYNGSTVASYIDHYENAENPNKITVEDNGFHVRNITILPTEDLGMGGEYIEDNDEYDYKLPEVELPILAWYSIPAASATEQRYQELKDCGFNISYSELTSLEDAKKALELGGKTGVKILFTCSDLVSNTAEIVNEVKDDPALYGYFLGSEPAFADLEDLKAFAGRIREADNSHPVYLNLSPSYSYEAVEAAGDGEDAEETPGSTYESYVKQAIETVKPSQVSFNYFPISDDGISAGWWKNLELMRDESTAAELPLWGFALATSHGVYPLPEESHLRLQMYTNLAYGAQCLQYFTYWCPPAGAVEYQDAPIAANGNHTDTYDMVKALNEELQARAGVFVGSTVRGVYQTGETQPAGTHPLTGSNPPIVKLNDGGNGSIIAFLDNGKYSYLLMVNRSYESGFNYSIEFEVDVQTVSTTGAVEDIGTDDSAFLEPGDCAIYRWKN